MIADLLSTYGIMIFNGDHHLHAHNSYGDEVNVVINGVLDTKSYDILAHCLWTFRTVGCGQDKFIWRSIVASLGKRFSRVVIFSQGVLMVGHPLDMWWV